MYFHVMYGGGRRRYGGAGRNSPNLNGFFLNPFKVDSIHFTLLWSHTNLARTGPNQTQPEHKPTQFDIGPSPDNSTLVRAQMTRHRPGPR